MSVGGERTHVGPDLRQDGRGRHGLDTRDGLPARHRRCQGREASLDTGVELGHAPLEVGEVREHLAEEQAVVLADDAVERLGEFGLGGPHPAARQPRAGLRGLRA